MYWAGGAEGGPIHGLLVLESHWNGNVMEGNNYLDSSYFSGWGWEMVGKDCKAVAFENPSLLA